MDKSPTCMRQALCRYAVAAGLAVVAALAAWPALAAVPGSTGMGGGGMCPMCAAAMDGWVGGLILLLGILLVLSGIAALVALAVFLVRRSRGDGSGRGGAPRAMA